MNYLCTETVVMNDPTAVRIAFTKGNVYNFSTVQNNRVVVIDDENEEHFWTTTELKFKKYFQLVNKAQAFNLINNKPQEPINFGVFL